MIICIIGKARHGKDTAGEIVRDTIENKYNLNVNKLALATPLKEEALKCLGLYTIEELDYYKNNNIPISGICVRELLTQLGDSHTDVNPDYFCDLAMDSVYKNNADDITIITDIRTKHEWDYFRKIDTVIFVKVVRDIQDCVSTHKTETESSLLTGDYNVFNKTLDVYKDEIRSLTTIIMDKYISNKKLLLDNHIPEEVYSVFNKSSYL